MYIGFHISFYFLNEMESSQGIYQMFVNYEQNGGHKFYKKFYADKKCFHFCPLLWPSSRKYTIYKWNLLCVYSDVYIIQYASGNLLFYQALPVLSRMEKRLKKEGWLLMPQSCSLENWRNVQFSESKISIFCNWHL